MSSSILSIGSTSLGTGVFFALGLILIFLAPRRRSHQFLAIWVFLAALSFILQQIGLNSAASQADTRLLLNITRWYGVVALVESVFSVYGIIYFLELQNRKVYRLIMMGITIWATIDLTLLTVVIEESAWLQVPFEFGRNSFNPFDFTSFAFSDNPIITFATLSTVTLLVIINWLNLLLFLRNDVPQTARLGSILFILATLVALSSSLAWLLPWFIMAGGISVTHAVLTSSLFDPLKDANFHLEQSLAEEQEGLALRLEETFADIEAKVLARRQELKEALQREQALAGELEKSLLQESELNSLKTQIIRNVSLEFRTPLNIIKHSSDRLTNGYDQLSQETRKQHQSEIVAQIFYLDEMLRDILFISRSNSKGVDANIERHMGGELFQQLQTHWGLTFGQHIDLQFHCDLPPQEVIYTDLRLIQRIGDSLILNAIKFSLDDAAMSILFSCGSHFELRFSDNGIGIPAGEVESIFELFQRGSNVGNRRGLGLGLYSVKKLIIAMGGQITAQTNAAQGTTFRLLLPMHTIDSENEQIASSVNSYA